MLRGGGLRSAAYSANPKRFDNSTVRRRHGSPDNHCRLRGDSLGQFDFQILARGVGWNIERSEEKSLFWAGHERLAIQHASAGRKRRFEFICRVGARGGAQVVEHHAYRDLSALTWKRVGARRRACRSGARERGGGTRDGIQVSVRGFVETAFWELVDENVRHESERGNLMLEKSHGQTLEYVSVDFAYALRERENH